MIAAVPLAEGGSLDVAGYATFTDEANSWVGSKAGL
jgi:hypothetical protein